MLHRMGPAIFTNFFIWETLKANGKLCKYLLTVKQNSELADKIG